MTTALSIIQNSLIDIGELMAGEAPTSDQANSALSYLNELISSWSIERLMVPSHYVLDYISADGSTVYAIGTGLTWNTVKPISVLNVRYSSGTTDYEMTRITEDEYLAIPQKTSTGQPDRYYINDNSQSTYSSIFVYPVPSTGTFRMASIKPLIEAATVSTDLALNAGYARALRLNLCVELMPQYGKSDPLIIQLAAKAKADIKRLNAANNPIVSALGLPYGNRSTGNILLGY